ncbi:MAG: FAD/NAD(P)-binding protein [Candidatus Sulfotelmatobacter sp.]
MPNKIFDIAIIGGGFTGTILALQLLNRHPSIRVGVIDRSSTPGRGLAYGTKDPNHFLNVPAENMSAFPDEPEHLVRWARDNHDPSLHPGRFLPRAVYGQYVASLLQAAMAPNRHRFDWLHGQALSLTTKNELLTLQLEGGGALHARHAVLALGNFPPPCLNIPGLSDASTRYAPSAWSRSALEGLRAKGNALLIGSGLTSVDVAISLRARGFSGAIHIVSRHGLLPQTHCQALAPYPPPVESLPRTVRLLLRFIRNAVRLAELEGGDWRSVVDAIRPMTAQIWSSWPQRERRRFLRHVRPYWEVHRHRIAPEIGTKLAAMIEQGQVHVYAGRLAAYSEHDNLAEVTFRERRSGLHRILQVDRVINCAGSENDCRRTDDPLLASLLAQGLVRPDPLFLGLDVDGNGALLTSTGHPSPALYAIGPARKGRLWESVAVPDLRVQAAQLAEHLVHQIVDVQDSMAEVAGNPGPGSTGDAKKLAPGSGGHRVWGP